MPVATAVLANGPPLWLALFPRPPRDVHKHQRGHVLVLSGPAHATGAARLAAGAALRAGAGLVTVLSPPGAVLVNAAHLTAVMVRPLRSPGEWGEIGGTAQALVLGPAAGVGEATRAHVLAAAACAGALVLDADALTSFQDASAALFAVLGPKDVLTPHAGEFARLFPDLAAGALTRVEQAAAAAVRSGAVVLLKGADTLIASPDGRIACNTSGTPHLATAGSGDVLAGVIAGLIAQGMPAWEAACAGAWAHGRAGELLGPGLIAEDLAPALPGVWRELLGMEPTS